MKNEKKQILIIRLSSLGDILLTTPVVRGVKNKYQGCEISFLCRKEYLPAIVTNPNITNVLTLETGINEEEISERIKNFNFDLIIDLQNNYRSKSILKNINVPIYCFKKPTLKKFLLVKFKINLFKHHLTIPELYARSVPELQLDSDGVELSLPDSFKTNLSPKEKYIGFIPGAKHFSKRWPEEYFTQLGQLLNKYGYIIAIFGGKDDMEICRKIASRITKVSNLCNDNLLYQTAVDMESCSLIIGNDSGLMHVASSKYIPLIVLFGSSVEEFGFAPYNREPIILQNETLKCRPCSHFGKDHCPKKHFKCMTDLTPNLVFEKIKKTLSL